MVTRNRSTQFATVATDQAFRPTRGSRIQADQAKARALTDQLMSAQHPEPETPAKPAHLPVYVPGLIALGVLGARVVR